jgi:hypothetical protein
MHFSSRLMAERVQSTTGQPRCAHQLEEYEDYWTGSVLHPCGTCGLLTPPSCFPFTSPPSRRVVPSLSNQNLLSWDVWEGYITMWACNTRHSTPIHSTPNYVSLSLSIYVRNTNHKRVNSIIQHEERKASTNSKSIIPLVKLHLMGLKSAATVTDKWQVTAEYVSDFSSLLTDVVPLWSLFASE